MNVEIKDRKIADLEDRELFDKMQQIVSLILDLLTSGSSFKAKDCRSNLIAMSHQTSSGFFLENHIKVPASLWTPWGKFRFLDDPEGNCETEVRLLHRYFGAKIIREEHFGPSSTIEAVYALHRINDLRLPDPIILRSGAFDPREKIQAALAKIQSPYSAQ